MSETAVAEVAAEVVADLTPEQKIEVQEQKYSARILQTALNAIDHAIESGQKSAKVQIMDWSHQSRKPDWAVRRILLLEEGIRKALKIKIACAESWQTQVEQDVEPPAEIHRLDLVIAW